MPRLGVSAPVGYSFYAFIGGSYLIDVYVGADCRAAKPAEWPCFCLVSQDFCRPDRARTEILAAVGAGAARPIPVVSCRACN